MWHSWHAGLVAEYIFEELCRTPVEVEYASEFRYRNPVIHPGDVILAISQSGETADTLVAIEKAKQMVHLFWVVNVGFIHCTNITCRRLYMLDRNWCIASTKAFTAQLAVLTMVALKIAKQKGSIDEERYIHLLQELMIFR